MRLLIDPRKIKVKIGNPAQKGKHRFTSLAQARKYEAAGTGYFFDGMFWFARGDSEERKIRRLYNAMVRPLKPNEITPDGSPALPPAPEYFRRMGYSRQALTR